jgi:nicotinamide mononucleotide transporter
MRLPLPDLDNTSVGKEISACRVRAAWAISLTLLSMQLFKQLLQWLQVDFIQFLVLVLGVAEVLLARANNLWLYPTGIVAIVLSTFGLFQAQLYAECSLNLYYLLMSVYGWFHWTRRKQGATITNATKQEWRITFCIVLGGWVLLYLLLLKFTTSDVPAWDASVTCTGWAGMWLLAKRKVENWILLNVSNAFALPLLIYKDLTMLAILNGILFAVACKGYGDWRRAASKQSIINVG